MNILEAMARMEGWQVSLTNRPTRNNNPGDIEYGKFALAYGAIGNDAGYAKFANATAGFAAMKALLGSPSYLTATIAGDQSGEWTGTVMAAIYRWCPPPKGTPMTDGNNPSEYVRTVCAWTGLKPSDPLARALAAC